MQILHGEDIEASRKTLQSILDSHRQEGRAIQRWQAKNATTETLRLALGSSSLFTQPRTVLIEELHSLPRSTRKNDLITLLSTAEAPDTEILLWEKRTLTKAMQKKFGTAKITEFKLKKSLFEWLDSIVPTGSQKTTSLLRKTLESENEYLCFILLTRRVRNMLYSKGGKTPAGAPFMVRKVTSQARRFTLAELLRLHTELHHHDRDLKFGSTPLSTSQFLHLVSSGMYQYQSKY